MESLFLLVLSMPAIESADSIRLLYRHFLSKVTENSLNAFYYACSYAKTDCSKFMNVTARLALQIIPEHLHSEPIFLCIDDTMVARIWRPISHTTSRSATPFSSHQAHLFVAAQILAMVPHFRFSANLPLEYHHHHIQRYFVLWISYLFRFS